MNVHPPEHVLRAAEEELATPTFAVSRQLLAVHAPVLENGSPHLAAAWAGPSGWFWLYYSVQNEPYFLVLSVKESDGKGEFGWMGVEAKIGITFGIDSDELSPAEITESLGVAPTYARAVGQPGRYAKLLAKSNYWRLEDEGPGPFDERLAALLELLKKHGAGFAALKGKGNCWISVGYHGYIESMNGLGLSRCAIAALAELGLDIGFDLYASGPELPR